MDSEAIEEAAARWFAKRQSGTWTEIDQSQFDAWLEEATAHRIQYIRVETAWKQSARMTALGAGVPAGVIPARGSWGDARFFRGTSPGPDPAPATEFSAVAEQTEADVSADFASSADSETPEAGTSRSFLRKRTRFFATAAGILALAIGAYIYNAGYFTGHRYTTPVGGMQNVALNDGSHVTLNTDTSLRAAVGDKERRIQLDRGEAFFEVAKDPTRPFVVYAGDKRVMALGTKFSVRRDGNDVQVAVTEGLVKLATADQFNFDFPHPSPGDGKGTQDNAGTPDPSAHDRRLARREVSRDAAQSGEATLLPAGAIARTSESEVHVRTDGSAEIEKLLSWRAGYVNLQDMPLADAVAEFNRYNTRKIFIEDPSIAAIHLSVNLRVNNTEAFLFLIQNGFPIRAEEQADRIVLKRK